ncbi:hypothetical protein F2Q68_00028787 [Brassica cretica]|uniref:Uncharacterized protein n=1 Tax=Brassica cretica TaxID=69181 RepID=A0A8S9G921_BRACR|nr:hypothetical protein F2Q68_00028787 [Brassica cretica]
MKKLRYVYDSMDEEMGMMRYVGDLGKEVVEVFVEHECSEHIPGVIHLSSEQRDDVEGGDEEEEHSENDEVDRPKKDNEPEESDDENQAEKEIVEEDNPAINLSDNESDRNENLNANEDGGDDVVVDEADGSNDVRFQTIFEEGLKSVPDKEAHGDGLQEEEKDDNIDDERAPVDVENPDTPLTNISFVSNLSDNESDRNENLNANEDGGDDVVVDEADGSNDVRFQTIFEEGLKSVPDKEAHGDGLQEEEKDDNIDDERAPVDVENPDTPVDSKDEKRLGQYLKWFHENGYAELESNTTNEARFLKLLN